MPVVEQDLVVEEVANVAAEEKEHFDVVAAAADELKHLGTSSRANALNHEC